MDSVLQEKARRANERISENFHILANEPSLAFYRLQENVRKTLPQILDRRAEAEKLHEELQGNFYDIEYAVRDIKAMENTVDTFKNVLELAKMSLFMRQQLKYLKDKRKEKDPSVYKRLSAHITLDLPDITNAIKDNSRTDTSNVRHSNMY